MAGQSKGGGILLLLVALAGGALWLASRKPQPAPPSTGRGEFDVTIQQGGR
jgi:hypothetical protein